MFAPSTLAPPEAAASPSMSQTEVEKLLASVGGRDALGAGPGDSSGGHGYLSRHDFPQLTSCSDDEMRRLRIRCETFISALAGCLSAHLRLECALQMTRLDTVRFQPFAEALSTPTFLTLFRLDPMASVCLLDIPARLALTVVDRELGGPAVCPEENRDLSQIEAKLAGKVATLMLGEWCNTWADVLPMRPAIVRHENSGRFLNLCPPDSKFLVLGVEVRIGQTVETIQIAFPPAIQKPMVAKLVSDLQNGEKTPVAQAGLGPRWNPAFNDMDIQVTARWSGLGISARQLAALKPGDLLPLRLSTTNQVEISLESLPKFTGQLGTTGQQWAVKIVESLKT